MQKGIYNFLRECALRRIPIREGCRVMNFNPASVRKYLFTSRRNRFLKHRIVKKGKSIGFRYDGVIVFWDRVERERGRRSGGYPP